MICGICSGQNLIPNPSFEDTVNCPLFIGQLNYATFWFSPTPATPDYYNECSSVFWPVSVNIPNTFVGFQYSRSGVGMAGLFPWYTTNGREYIEVPLDSTLIVNVCYHFEMYINRANESTYESYNLGAYFSDTLIYSSVDSVLPLIPQVANVPGNLPDTLNWTLVSGDFIALGGEKFLTIGNFEDDLGTDTILINPSGNSGNYIYIDDVSLTRIPLIECASSIMEQKENVITIYPNPFADNLKVEVNNYEPTEIIFFDITSRKIFQQTFANITIINTEQLAKGMYLYEVRNTNGIIKNGKVIKQ